MSSHSTWKNWDGPRLPSQLYWDLCDAVNGLILSKQLPDGIFYRFARSRKGWVVVTWRPEATPDKQGRPLEPLPEVAYPISDILADGQAALKKLRYRFDRSGREFKTIRLKD